jgi:hypothetical protein
MGEHHHHDSNRMAVSATLHCLTGCATGEILGLMIGTAIGLATGWTIAVSVALAFLFGYTLSSFPLLKSGLAVGTAFTTVLAADTLSILTMEVVDNAVMAAIPGAMDAGLVNVVFWLGMAIAFTAAFFAAWPVNRYLLARGRGHALSHGAQGDLDGDTGWRRCVPSIPTGALVAVLAAFMLGGLSVSVADELQAGEGGQHAAPVATVPR